MGRTVVAAIGLLCAGVLGTGVLAGCTGSGSGGTTSSGGSVGDVAANAPAAAAGQPSRAAAGGQTGGAGGTADSTESTTGVLDTGLRIRTAVMQVGIRGSGNVASKASDADTIALNAGGEIDTDDRTSGRHATATVQVRVPPAQLQAVLTAFGRLGREQNRQVSSKDVTQRVADVASRAASAEASITRLRRLYASARKVSDVIAIEDELSSRESDLESLQAQQRALSRETAMASVTLNLSTLPVQKHHHAATKPKPSHHGFLGGLYAGWHGFTTLATGVATAAGAALPFALLLLLLGSAARLLWPRLARLRRVAPDPASPADRVS